MSADLAQRVVNLFGGPGGWCVAAERLGVTDNVGIEWDADACATALAAGHKRLQADVSMIDTRDYAGITGLIGSPPCQSYSSAGRQKGKLDRTRIEAHVARIRAAGRWLHYSRHGWHDDRSPLVLEPLRFALDLRPEWVALEQVPAVLPLWEAFADVLRDHGWHVATGALSAEQYGVPQTRKRVFLVARRCVDCGQATCPEAAVSLPAPTHRPYRKGVARDVGDPALLPWVSMADALGWRHGGYVGFPRRADAGEVLTLDGVDYQARDLRSTDEPAQALTEKARSWQLRQSAMANATVRGLDEPAPTITAGHDRAERVWEPVALAQAGATSTMVDPRPLDAPAGTVTGKGTGYWVPTTQRSRQSVAGVGRATRSTSDPSVTVSTHPPEWLGERGDPGIKSSAVSPAAVRVSVAEASVLQTFPADYPWQGSRTVQYRQVGDAVPPLLAEAVLRQVIPA